MEDMCDMFERVDRESTDEWAWKNIAKLVYIMEIRYIYIFYMTLALFQIDQAATRKNGANFIKEK
jgi:hypothetical protein